MDRRSIDWLNSLIVRDVEVTAIEDVAPKATIGLSRGLATTDDVQQAGVIFPLEELSRQTTPLEIFSTDGTVKITFNRIDRMLVQDGAGNTGEIIFKNP